MLRLLSDSQTFKLSFTRLSVSFYLFNSKNTSKKRDNKTKSKNKHSSFSIKRQIATGFHDIILFVL